MHEMQAAQPGDYKGPASAATANPPRLLESPEGVITLYFCDKPLARAGGLVTKVRYVAERITWLHWQIERLHWGKASSLKFLQGVSIQQLLGPRYTVVRLKTVPVYDPAPRLVHVELAEVIDAEDKVQPLQLCELARRVVVPLF